MALPYESSATWIEKTTRDELVRLVSGAETGQGGTGIIKSAFHDLSESERRLKRLRDGDSCRPHLLTIECSNSIRPLEEDCAFFSVGGNADLMFSITDFPQDGADVIKAEFLRRARICLRGLRREVYEHRRTRIRNRLIRAETLVETRVQAIIDLTAQHGEAKGILKNAIKHRIKAKKGLLAESREKVRAIRHEIEEFEGGGVDSDPELG